MFDVKASKCPAERPWGIISHVVKGSGSEIVEPDARTIDIVIEVQQSVPILPRGVLQYIQKETVDVDLPDSLHIFGRFANGALLNYHFSGIEPGGDSNTIKLVGSKGSLRIDIDANQLLFCKSGGDCQEVPIPESDRRGWQVEADFIDSIRNGTPVRLTNFADGVRYMAFSDAVFRNLT